MDQSIIDIFKFSFLYSPPKTVKTRPCRIKVLGQFITTNSKKTVWRNKGFAKSALLNHVLSCPFLAQKLTDKGLKNCYGRLDSDAAKKLILDLEKEGVIEYVEASVEEFAERKI